MTLYLVRHAHAGRRSAWTSDDRLRPLTERGRTQAEKIGVALEPARPGTILTSPAVRCLQTVLPLADRLGTPAVGDPRIFEGARRSVLEDLIADVADDDVVLCSHGDVIPMILDLLIDDGLRIEGRTVWQKASTWTIGRDDGSWVSATYAAPPA